MVLGAVGWQPTGLIGVAWMVLGAVGQQPTGLMAVLCSPLDGFGCCRSTTYRSYGSPLDNFKCCTLATYRSFGSLFVGVIGEPSCHVYAPVQMCLCFRDLNLASLAPPPSEDGARA